MLVLERKVQEGFWIDQRIYIKVIGISKRRVKLGIEAPLDLRVTRSELGPTAAATPASRNSSKPAAQSVGPSGASAELRRGRRRSRNDQRVA